MIVKSVLILILTKISLAAGDCLDLPSGIKTYDDTGALFTISTTEDFISITNLEDCVGYDLQNFSRYIIRDEVTNVLTLQADNFENEIHIARKDPLFCLEFEYTCNTAPRIKKKTEFVIIDTNNHIPTFINRKTRVAQSTITHNADLPIPSNIILDLETEIEDVDFTNNEISYSIDPPGYFQLYSSIPNYNSKIHKFLLKTVNYITEEMDFTITATDVGLPTPSSGVAILQIKASSTSKETPKFDKLIYKGSYTNGLIVISDDIKLDNDYIVKEYNIDDTVHFEVKFEGKKFIITSKAPWSAGPIITLTLTAETSNSLQDAVAVIVLEFKTANEIDSNPYAYLLINLKEKIIYKPIVLRMDEENKNNNYVYCLISQYPGDEVLFETDDEGNIVAKELDREASYFETFIVPQFRLKIKRIQKTDITNNPCPSPELEKSDINELPHDPFRTTMTIIVDDVNDNKPEFPTLSIEVYYPDENLANILKPSHIIQVTATDKDADEIIRYTTISKDITVDAVSGIVYATDNFFKGSKLIQIVAVDSSEKIGVLDLNIHLLSGDQICSITLKKMKNINAVESTLQEISTANEISLEIVAAPAAIIYDANDDKFNIQVYIYALEDNKILTKNQLKELLEDFEDIEIESVNEDDNEDDNEGSAGKKDCNNSGLLAAVIVLSCLLVLFILGVASVWYFKLRFMMTGWKKSAEDPLRDDEKKNGILESTNEEDTESQTNDKTDADISVDNLRIVKEFEHEPRTSSSSMHSIHTNPSLASDTYDNNNDIETSPTVSPKISPKESPKMLPKTFPKLSPRVSLNEPIPAKMTDSENINENSDTKTKITERPSLTDKKAVTFNESIQEHKTPKVSDSDFDSDSESESSNSDEKSAPDEISNNLNF